MEQRRGESHSVGPPVLIVGGGHAGLLLALALERGGVAVTVIEARASEHVLAAPFDGHALALMYGSKRVFDAIGVWPAFAELVAPVVGVRIQDQATGGTVDYAASDVGDHPFAYGIETRTLRRRLLELVLERSDIELVAPAELAGLRRHGRQVTLRLADGRELTGALVVGADGRGSTVRERAGIRISRRAYGQSAITFAVRHGEPHGHRVREYMRPAGPLALLPLGPRHSAVTWVERTPMAEHLLARGPETLLEGLAERTENVLGTLELLGEPRVHPLGVLQARRPVAPRVALIGDAAHGVHPIHAQGFNLGVRDVATLAEVLVEAARGGQDLGGGEVLLRYARARQADVRTVVALTDGLNRLFSNDLEPVMMLRRLGLGALDRVAPLKRLAMRRGMGLADLPRQALGACPRNRKGVDGVAGA